MRLTHLLLLVAVVGCSRSSVENADRMNTFQLMTAAAAASSAGHVADAGFLFFASEARFQIDKQVYPAVGTGGDSPGVLKAAMNVSVSPAIARGLAADPAAFQSAAAALAKWSPKFEAGYDPGWKYANPLSGAAIAPVVAGVQKEMLKGIEGKAKLLDNAKYRKLADDVAATTKVESAYWATVDAKHSANAVPDELKQKFGDAQLKHAGAAKRMKEIELATNPESRWYAQVGWKAEDYFDDPKVVASCKAIEDDNVPEMKRLIAAGANVKAVGKDGMTPLLWAFPDRLVDRFECLLKNGADPNVVIKSDFNTKARPFHPYPIGGSAFPDRGCHAGQSVTLLAARSPVIEYLNLVMEHGGDAKAIDGKTGEAMLDVVLDRNLFDCDQRVAMLVSRGADVNRYCQFHAGYPAMEAVNSDRYDVALALLKAGADPSLRPPGGGWKLTGLLAHQEQKAKDFQPATAADYGALVKWLEQHGETIEGGRQEAAKSGK